MEILIMGLGKDQEVAFAVGAQGDDELSLEPVGATDAVVHRLNTAVEDALAVVGSFATAVGASIATGSGGPNEVEIEFGLTLDLEGKFAIVASSLAGTATVRATWTRSDT